MILNFALRTLHYPNSIMIDWGFVGMKLPVTNIAKRSASSDVDILEQWWIEKSRVNFFAYRQFMRYGDFRYNWFIASLSSALQQFYEDYCNGLRPILIISCPPQHGKTWGIEDLIAWIAGMNPNLRQVYSSFSDNLGIRCNAANQRVMSSEKYQKIFPETNINGKNIVTLANNYKKNSTQIEFINKRGSFRNTTVEGQITGETLDIGYIDDPFKGRKEANSKTTRDNVWNWFTDDFGTRFADNAGYIITMTRWHTDDLVGRLIKKIRKTDAKVTEFKYEAIATQDEQYRKKGDALFPALKSLEFLLGKRALMLDPAWQSLYQGAPVVEGGNLIKVEWWRYWDSLPLLQYTFIVADTAQKKNTWNDFTSFQLWGHGVDGNIYLLDMVYARMSAPELRANAEIFYRKHDNNHFGCEFKGIAIEDKSSGTGLIQEMEAKGFRVFAIPRTVDKITRAYDTGPSIKIGRVYLNAAIPYVGVIIEESKQFPNGEFDDAFDCTMSAIEVVYLYPEILNSQIFVA